MGQRMVVITVNLAVFYANIKKIFIPVIQETIVSIGILRIVYII